MNNKSLPTTLVYVSPTVFKDGAFRYYFFSREETRKHIHIIGPEGEAKLWLEPELKIASVNGLTEQAVGRCLKVVQKRIQEILDAWDSHFGS